MEYYTLPETPKIEGHVELGIDDVKAKRTKNILEMIEILIERMKVETQELSRRTIVLQNNWHKYHPTWLLLYIRT